LNKIISLFLLKISLYMKNTLFILLTVGFFISCTSVNEESKNEVTKHTIEQNEVKVTIEDQSDVKVENGPFIEKFPNGGIKIKGEMLNGNRDGVWVAYFQSGIKQSESTYLNGVLNGKYAVFYENGNIRMAGYYDNGERDGVWRLYKKDGAFDRQINYKDGEELK